MTSIGKIINSIPVKEPVHCLLSPYKVLKPCSKTCGVGALLVYKEALVMHKNGGKACPPHELKPHLKECNTHDCPGI